MVLRVVLRGPEGVLRVGGRWGWEGVPGGVRARQGPKEQIPEIPGAGSKGWQKGSLTQSGMDETELT